MPNVLLITEEAQRYYWEKFIPACADLGVTLFIFDTSQFPSRYKIRLQMTSDGGVTGSLSASSALSAGGEIQEIDISQIDVAWFLRPGEFSISDDLSPFENEFAKEESRHALITLTEVLPCPWVNDRRAIRRADDSKFYQQMVAARVGLKVPATLMSNVPTAATDLVRLDGQCLVKSMGILPLGTDTPLHIYSNLFTAEEIGAASASIAACPIYAQEYVPKRYEYRVVVAGAEVLACRIDSQASERTKVDWRRYDFENVTHTYVELPGAVAASLRRFMREIGLTFGSVDLIETPAGEFVFLEVNPSGQWDWISQLAGVPVPDAVARMLSDIVA